MEKLEAKELRIGNLVNWKTTNPSKVEMIDGQCGVGGLEGVELCPISDWQPIPLTEEWLIKFGFNAVGDEYWTNDYVKIPIEEKRLGGTMLLTPYTGYAKELKHVHQLQNLYHALTGEELTIKQ